MELQTEYAFRLPRGYLDEEGVLHKDGVMRLATAGDELAAMRNPNVKAEESYMTIALLARVITCLGTVDEINADVIEHLFTADMEFLQNMYRTINEADKPQIRVVCPHCGEAFQDTLNFTELG